MYTREDVSRQKQAFRSTARYVIVRMEKLLIKKPLTLIRGFFVVWGGIEPPTQGFSVLCSTD